MKGGKLPISSRQLREFWDKYKLILLVLVAGILLMAIPMGGGKEEKKTSQPSASTETFNLKASEEKFARALSQIDGAGEVTVVLTVKTGSRQVLAENNEFSEKDNGMEESSSPVVLSKGSGVQEAVPLQEIYPQFQGALIVCTGGDDPQVKLKLVEAATALTGLGADKISICKGK